MTKMGLEVGQTASVTKTITAEDVSAFAEFTGDNNPIHLDEGYARQTRFGRPIAHGVLVAGLISTVIGTKLPGPGTIYLHQEMDFRRPVYPGDTVTAMVEVIGIRPDKAIVTLATRCTNQEGQLVLEGKAVVLVDRQQETP